MNINLIIHDETHPIVVAVAATLGTVFFLALGALIAVCVIA